jgi:AcrR family transcriptional regulator
MARKRRDSIISAATLLLDRGGPSAVTMRDVAKTVGVVHTAAYKHFSDKSDLLAAIAERELARRAATLDRTEPATPQSMAAEYLDWAQQYPERFKLIFFGWDAPPPAFREHVAQARKRLVAVVKTAQAEGVLPRAPPHRLSALILATAHGAAELARSGSLSPVSAGRIEPADVLADLFGYLTAAAKPDGGQNGP